MGLIGLNCSDCSHSLLSDSCKVFAANLLVEFDLFNGRVFSANCGLECEEGICDAIAVFQLGLLSLCDSVNCEAIDFEVLECGKCDAINFL